MEYIFVFVAGLIVGAGIATRIHRTWLRRHFPYTLPDYDWDKDPAVVSMRMRDE
jgi:hypothetical protein